MTLRLPRSRWSPIALGSSLLLAACASSDSDNNPASADGGDGTAFGDAGGSSAIDADIPDEPWIVVEAGSFQMGSPDSEACRDTDEDLHTVTLTRSFLMQTRETTQQQFRDALGYNHSRGLECGSDCPAENLTWHMATAYCDALSEPEGLPRCFECTGGGEETRCTVKADYADPGAIYDCPGYRLPTEAEWERAYRAGAQTSFYNGELDIAMCNELAPLANKIGWFIRNSQSATHPVAAKAPNVWGFYDMGGNAQEWVYDHWQESLGTDDVVDPAILNEGNQGIIRGGSFAHAAADMRAAHRKKQTLTSAGTSLGVRCVRTVTD